MNAVTRSLVSIAGLCCSVGWVGCSDTDTPTEADYDDVAQALGGVTATGDGGGEIGSMHDAVAIASGTPTIGIDLRAAGEWSGSRLAMVYDYAVTCADAAGVKLETCGDTTDSAEIAVTWSGELVTPILSGSVDRSGSLSVTGAQSEVVTIDGTSDLEIGARFESLFRRVTREYNLAYHAEYEGVKVDHASHRITAGRASYALSVERMATTGNRESSANFEIDAELVFGAQGGAVLTLDGAHEYAVDPESGAVTKM